MASWKRIPTVSDKLSVFAATSSSELRGVLSDESGSGVAIFAGGNIGAGDATTQSASNNTTKIATTAYVDNQASLGDTSLANTKIWIGTSGGAKAEFALSGDATMTAGGVVSVGTLNQSTTGTAGIATTVTVADESSDTSCYPMFATAASGNLGPKSGSNLTFNSSTGLLSATGLAGAGSGITALSGSNIASGTVAAARVATLNQNTTGDAARVTSGTQSSITTTANLVTVGTIGTGVWQGTAINQTYLVGQSGTNTGDQTLPTRASLGLDTDDAVTFGDLTVTNEFVATSGTVTLTGQVAIADEIVILNSDHASSAAVDGVDVGFEVERGTSTNAKFLWNEKGGVAPLSRWELTMIDDQGDPFTLPISVMGTDQTKVHLARAVGDGAFYQASNALYCYL